MNFLSTCPLLFAFSLTGMSKTVIWSIVLIGSLVTGFVFRQRWQRTSVLARCIFLSIFVHGLMVLLLVTTGEYWSSRPLGAGLADSDREVRVRFTQASAEPKVDAMTTPPVPEPWDETPPDVATAPVVAPNLLPAALAALPTPPAPDLLPELPSKEETKAADPIPAPLATVEQLMVEVAPRYAEDPGRAVVNAATNPVVAAPKPADTTIRPAPASPAKPVTSHENVPDVYRQRFDRSSADVAAAGGTPDSEAAVKLALAWLARNQEEDGRWSAVRHEAGRGNPRLGHDRGDTGADADTGLTALALLAFLGSGQTHLEGEHREAVQHGLEYLIRMQQPGGSLAGNAKLFASMYCHGMATFALCEALALTGDERIRPAAQRAVAYTLAAQHSRGGWRYQPGDPGDMSQFGWQVMSLRSAELAGIPVPAVTKDRARLFLDTVASGRARGLAGYRANERVTRTMTAEALVCRHILQPVIEPATTSEATNFVLEELPARETTNVYYWYYATLALRFGDGRPWQTWNRALQEELLTAQRRSGPAMGSWDPDASWGSFGGRVYQTALSTLCLESYYRYSTAHLDAAPIQTRGTLQR